MAVPAARPCNVSEPIPDARCATGPPATQPARSMGWTDPPGSGLCGF
ncbi:hypothetical protein RSPO_m00321 (plasmid) [Ralstonia solanacearum Po82]|uniref:Uncharacterized protein n=1 Tax=Ralstonia solanacearum (strain Po82) TaxID=1031711 RepID=F6G8D4_RALS8|nr:hypothetical protein RSPO_m00321 [Ralstonia solanacearum Po82]